MHIHTRAHTHTYTQTGVATLISGKECSEQKKKKITKDKYIVV